MRRVSNSDPTVELTDAHLQVAWSAVRMALVRSGAGLNTGPTELELLKILPREERE